MRSGPKSLCQRFVRLAWIAAVAGLMMIGCGMMTTSVPTIITAGVTGSLPGASDYRATSGAWGQDQFSMSRVLLSENGATAASGDCATMLLDQRP